MKMNSNGLDLYDLTWIIFGWLNLKSMVIKFNHNYSTSLNQSYEIGSRNDEVGRIL